jgi:tetratricopeptide (TPR) repeat protein
VLAAGITESRFEATHAGALTQFIGREHETALLTERWERATLGEGQVVLLSGEAGIGKSRLVKALRETIEAGAHFGLSYQCSPLHQNSALYPVIRQLEWAAGFAAGDPNETKLDKLEALLEHSAADVAAVAPLFAALLSLDGEARYGTAELTPQQRKDRTLQALEDQLMGLARQRPVLFVFEDVHWIDPTSQDLLTRTVGRINEARVLMLITFRPEFSAEWLNHPHVMSLTLNRLSRAQGQEMVMVAGGALAPGIVAELAQRADGVPLFIEELARSVVEAGGQTKFADIPTTLQALLMARLDRLDTAKEVAQTGAVIGRDFAHALLAEVVEITDQKLEMALDRLLNSGLILRRGAPPDISYNFKHTLIQDAAYHSLLSGPRRDYHKRVAAAIERLFPAIRDGQPEYVARHLSEAGEYEKAAHYWLAAGRSAIARAASREAIAHFDHGLADLGEMPDGEQRSSLELDTQIAMASAYIAAEGYAATETEQAYLRARELLPALQTDSRNAAVLHGLYVGAFNRGQMEPALRYAHELLGWADRHGDPEALCVAHRSVAVTLNGMARFAEALDHAEKAVAHYDPDVHGDSAFRYGHDVGVAALWHKALAANSLGYTERAQTAANAAMSRAEEVRHPLTTAYAYFWKSWMYVQQREAAAARENAEYLVTFSDERLIQLYSGIGRILLGAALMFCASSEEEARKSVVLIDEGRHITDTARSFFFASVSLIHRAEGLVRLGRLDEALQDITHAGELIDERVSWYGPELFRIRARIRLAECNTSKAEADLKRAITVAKSQQSRLFHLRAACDLARLWRDQGKTAKAHDLLAPVHSWFTEGFGTPDLKDARALLDELS